MPRLLQSPFMHSNLWYSSILDLGQKMTQFFLFHLKHNNGPNLTSCWQPRDKVINKASTRISHIFPLGLNFEPMLTNYWVLAQLSIYLLITY
jgi:hypothetical protein